MKVDVEIVAFAGVGINVIIEILMLASGSDKGVGFRVLHCDCRWGAVVLQFVLGVDGPSLVL